jgi:hypothetical protein
MRLKVPNHTSFPVTSINTGVNIILIEDVIHAGIHTELLAKLFGHQ